MFRKTRIRLSIMNAVVFFIILTVLSVVLYVYMQHLVFRTVDEKLNNAMDKVREGEFHELMERHEREPETERKIAYIFWNESGEVANVLPKSVENEKEMKYFKPSKGNRVETQEILGHSYRVVTVPSIAFSDQSEVKKVGLVLNIDSEKLILHHLLLLMVGGIITGIILSLVAGLFLANRALIPIQRSWDKQTRFVADASHELRTPLAVIQAHLELLFRHPTHTVEEESEAVYKSLHEVTRINKLVSDLLTLARVDSDQLLLERTEFPPGEILEFVSDQFTPVAEMKGIQFQKTLDTQNLYKGDQARIQQLFMILLDNALKYSPADTTIHLFCKKEGEAFIVQVSDEGVGIKEEDIPFVFDRFYRGDKARNRSQGGTGLGLSIAKWIVEAHGGDIKVKSTENKGSTFTIRLPKKQTLTKS
ncbi:sensor histidine kinase [Priestia koreensis]|uniref:sensor histidine kinase n=2 Tax=Priestia koreensis TaxID=284581 RepID=UPI001F55B88D|nr:HAMP domain-containing sensor histidine kinase [Priestia koreensis]UNL85200.1 HAMP domain-containing histidine kinase [Priestia koreensis]